MHGVVTVHLLIVLAMATAALLDPRWMYGRRLVGALAIGGAIAAVGAVDQQFVIYGLAPLLAMAAYVAVQQRAWRPFLVAAGFSLIALVGRTLLVRAGEAAQIVPTGRVFNFVGVDRVATQLGMFPGAVGELIVSNVWVRRCRVRSCAADACGVRCGGGDRCGADRRLSAPVVRRSPRDRCGAR